MPPIDAIKLENESKEKSLNDDTTIGDSVTQLDGGKDETIGEGEMVTSFIEENSVSGEQKENDIMSRIKEDRKSCIIELKKIIDETSGSADPGEGTSGNERNKSVVINLPNKEPIPVTPISNDNQEKVIINGTSTATTTESSAQIFHEVMLEEKQTTASTKSTKRHELVRWDNRRSCFFVFFLLLFFIWVIVYYLYASGWLYRKINHIR